jgi:3-carboxy-cis,cis-muconate cycloisomerase
MFSRGAAATAVGEEKWLAAMLEVEAELARAAADVGLVPPAAAEQIAAACDPARLDRQALEAGIAAAGNPVVELVRQIEAVAGSDAGRFVHLGATSQDIVDTATMLVSRRALDAVAADLAAAAVAAAGLARAHPDAIVTGRTLLQQAAPLPFALVAAGWASALGRQAKALRQVRAEVPALQFGGAVGSLASLGDRGIELRASLARRLDLPEPAITWHTDRSRPARIATAFGEAAGVVGKVALDVVLSAQTEVGELAESGDDRGRSSAMPQKRNPVAAVSALACVRQTPGLVATLLASMPQEHQRAAGAWQAEWPALAALARFAGSAAAWLRDCLEHLTVDEERMAANLAAAGGLPMAEAASAMLAPDLGRAEAHRVVADAARRAREEQITLAEALGGVIDLPEPGALRSSADAMIAAVLSDEEGADAAR